MRYLLGSQHSIQASGRTLTMDHTNWGVALMQHGDNSLCYDISMEGSGDACAVICISGSGIFAAPLHLTQLLKFA